MAMAFPDHLIPPTMHLPSKKIESRNREGTVAVYKVIPWVGIDVDDIVEVIRNSAGALALGGLCATSTRLLQAPTLLSLWRWRGGVGVGGHLWRPKL